MNRKFTVCLALVWVLSSPKTSCLAVAQEEGSSGGAAFYVASIPELGTHLIREDSERLLYYPQGTHISPRISPDHDRVLLHSRRGGEIGVWLGDIRGGELTRLCDGDQSNWSPDGSRIILRRAGRVVEHDLSSGEELEVTPPEYTDCMYPSYLSDSCVLFVNQNKIYALDQVSGQSRILAAGEISSAPRASADGLKLAWQEGAHLTMLELGSGESTGLTSHGGIQSWPVWSEDGEYLIFCQSPLPEGPWDLYVTEVENPGKIWLIRRGIHPSPDWRGVYSPEFTAESIVGSQLTVRSAGNNSSRDVLIENRWLRVHCSPRKNPITLSLPGGSGAASSIEISPMVTGHQESEQRPRIRTESDDPVGVQLSLSYGSVDSTPLEIKIRVPRTRPFIELTCQGFERILLNAETTLAVIPDRLANDLVLDPAAYDTSAMTIPYTPFLLAPIQAGSGLMMLVTPDQNQQTKLRSRRGAFEQIEVIPGSEPVFVSLLPQDEHWQEVEVYPTDTQDKWLAGWTHPFLAQWRLAAVVGENGYSRSWGEEALNRNRSSFIPIDGRFATRPEHAIVYLFGRSWHTPLEVFSPLDLLVDAVGLSHGIQLLDEKGIRAYRIASGQVFFREITTREEKWNRELVHVDSRDPNWVELGVLESMQGLRAADTPGVRSLITHSGQDIMGILEGLDDRIDEYETFLKDLRRFCRSYGPRTEKIREFLTKIEHQAGVVQVQGEQMPRAANKAISAAIEEILGSLGTGQYLHSTEEYGRLSKAVRSSQKERLALIQIYRDFAKSVCTRVGYDVTREADLKRIGDQLRQMTHNLLRNRYYLENDWNGETPLRRGAD